MLLLTDVDDCLLDWFHGFRKFIVGKGLRVSPDHPGSWDLEHWFLDKVDIRALIHEFNHSEAFEQLPAYADAVHALNELRGQGFKIVAVTSCSDAPEVKARRERNLIHYFGSIFLDVFCIPLGASKFEILSKYPPAYWVEDRPEGALAGRMAGHKCFLITKTYNADFSHHEIHRCANWTEILPHIKLV